MMNRSCFVLLFYLGIALALVTCSYGMKSSVKFRGGCDEACLRRLDSCLTGIMTSLSEGGLEDYRECFTDEGFAALEQLLAKRPVENADPQYHPQLIRHYRPQPMLHTSASEIREARSFRVLAQDDGTALYLVFTIDGENKIVDSWFGMDDAAYTALLDAGQRIPDEAVAEQVRSFLDKLAHAYSVRDTSYIFDAYSDRAVMVFGKQLNVVANYPELPPAKARAVERSDLRYEFRTPQQHFDKLRGIYETNKSVRVSYEDIKVEGTALGDVYSVTLRQRWRSSTYNDDGFLLFAVEHRKTQPLILMRNWDSLPFTVDDIDQWMSRIGPALPAKQ